MIFVEEKNPEPPVPASAGNGNGDKKSIRRIVNIERRKEK